MIRIGIVGCGRILAAHLKGYQILRQAGVDDFRITALCARRPDDAQMYLRRGEGPPQRKPVSTAAGDPLAVGDIYLSDFQDDAAPAVYTDYAQMIAEAKIDAVNDFTMHGLHHLVAAEAFRHGKHLLTQKPLAITMAAGRRMCDEAEARGLVLGVFENARFRPPTRHVKWLLESGRIGRLQLMTMLNLGNWWAPDLVVARTPWRHRFLEGGGIAMDIGVHWFDVFRYLGGEIATVAGEAAVVEPLRSIRDDAGKVLETIDCDADDFVRAAFTTAEGVRGSMTIGWCGHGEGVVVGESRGVAYHATAGSVVGETVTPDGGGRQALAELYEQHREIAWHQRHFPLGLEDAFALNQHDWLEAIRHRREPETSGREGLRDMAAAMAVLESSRAGRRVEVEEVYAGALREFQRPLDAKYCLS